MAKKIKILHIINNLEIGGAEKILVLLLNKFSQMENLELHLVLLNGRGSLVADLPGNIKIKEFNFNIFRGGILGRLDPYFRLSLFRYVRSIKPDVIHGHLLKAEDFAKVLGLLTNTPVVITLHDTLFKPDYRTRFLNKYLAKVIAVSDIVKKYAISSYRTPKNRVVVIPNAVNTNDFDSSKKNFDKNKPVFMYIGRLLKIKGIEDAIIGLSKLIADYPDLEFLIYGKEVAVGYKDRLQKMTTDNGWSFVKFMGSTNDVPDALSSADVFIYPSKSEGFAISVLEAAAANKPIIATNTGAIAQIVINGVSGAIVEWNNPDQIYQAAKNILDNDLAEAYGDAARDIAERQFSIDKITDMHLELYKDVLRLNK